MTSVNIKHMRRVRSKGSTYWYHRKTGERLPDDEAARIRRVLEINEGLDTPSRKVKVGTVEAIANIYRASPAFKDLAERTRLDYDSRLKMLCSLWGDQPVAAIARRHVIRLQDEYADKPATADRNVTVLRVLLAFAVKREYRDDNPAEGVEKLRKPSQVEGHRPWPDWAVEKFLKVHDGTVMGLGAMIGLYTGQRQADCLAMRWSDIVVGDDGIERISVKQAKTGTALEIRLHATLRAALDATEKRSPIILTAATGRPYKGSNFRHHFAKAIKDAGLGDQGLSFHGLRYAAASKLAELGLSVKHIASVTGHQSLAMVQKYTKGAEQRQLNDAAILHWEEHPSNTKLENRDKGSGKLEAKALRRNGN